jgi:hypothetical protein
MLSHLKFISIIPIEKLCYSTTEKSPSSKTYEPPKVNATKRRLLNIPYAK